MKRLSFRYLSIVALTASVILTPSVFAQGLLPSWHDVNGTDPTSLQAAGWQLNASAQTAGSFTMPSLGYFRLHDDDTKSAPSATLPFKPLGQGTMTLNLGVADLQNSNAMLRLMDGDIVLMEVFLLSNEKGSLKTGAGKQEFVGKSWGKDPRQLVITWKGAGEGKVGTVSVAFDAGTPEGRNAAKIENVPFLSDGTPSAIKLEVGFGTAVNRTLLASDLNLQNTPSALPVFANP